LRHLNKANILRAAAAADTGKVAGAITLEDVPRKDRTREDCARHI
jgi:hypothetical protein